MKPSSYATPLDDSTVMVRRSPETPLWAWELDSASHGDQNPVIAVRVVLRHSQRALRPKDWTAIEPYFEWPSHRTSFWWSTAQPAQFRLERVAEDSWIGRLMRPGRMEAVAGAPTNPSLYEHHDYLCRAYFAPTSADAEPITADPRVRDVRRRGEAQVVWQSRAMLGWLAEFRQYGNEQVWMRAYREDYGGHFVDDVFDGEIALLRTLAAALPAAAVDVLHRGTLQAGPLSGPYLATTLPVGLDLDHFFKVARPRAAESRFAAAQIALDLLHITRTAHERDMCLGAVSPGLLWVRQSYVARQPALRLMLVAAPLAGPAGERPRRRSRDYLPTGPISPRLDAGGYDAKRSVGGDLQDAGFVLQCFADQMALADADFRDLADSLQAGRFASSRDALTRLLEFVPDTGSSTSRSTEGGT